MVLLHILQKHAPLGKITSLHKLSKSFESIVLADKPFLGLRLRLRVQMGRHDTQKRLHDPRCIARAPKSAETQRIAAFPRLRLFAKPEFDSAL